MPRTCPMWRPEPGRFDLHEECENPSPREDYEHHFGYIDEDQWQWLKEWAARNTPDEGVREKEWDFNEYVVLREVTPWDLVRDASDTVKQDQHQSPYPSWEPPENGWQHWCKVKDGKLIGFRNFHSNCGYGCGVERPQTRAN